MVWRHRYRRRNQRRGWEALDLYLCCRLPSTEICRQPSPEELSVTTSFRNYDMWIICILRRGRIAEMINFSKPLSNSFLLLKFYLSFSIHTPYIFGYTQKNLKVFYNIKIFLLYNFFENLDFIHCHLVSPSFTHKRSNNLMFSQFLWRIKEWIQFTLHIRKWISSSFSIMLVSIFSFLFQL